MAKVWQHPFLNVFKHFKVEEWKRSTKEGDVTTVMDKTLKGTVYRISGSVPASNYLQLPKTSTQSLGLTGCYLYILFKPMPTKYFVVHLDVATEDSQVVRISFSNLFKEFKSTATWLQFPFICGAAKGSIHENTAKAAKRDLVGLAPANVRWTFLTLDLRHILSLYLNRSYSHLKSVKLCSNLLVKNLFTSNLLFDPAMSFSEAQQSKLVLNGVSPVPREMAFPVPKGENWHDIYDYIRFPLDGSKLPFDSIQKGALKPAADAPVQDGPVTLLPKQVTLSKPVRDRVSLIQQITSPKEMPRQSSLLTKNIPRVKLATSEPLQAKDQIDWREGTRAGDDPHLPLSLVDDGGIHVYAHKNGDITIHAVSVDSDEDASAKMPGPKVVSSRNSSRCTRLLPDPILKLKRVIGFGGCSTRWALWAANSSVVVYPCHALIVAVALDSGRQWFFAGHTDKVAALAFNGNSTLLASAQIGHLSMMRLWDFATTECLSMFKTGMHAVSCLSFSYNGNILCGTGKDRHGKTMVVVWNTSQVSRGGEVELLAKAHTDVDIQTLKIAFFDDTRMVSCGRDNVRLWRVRSRALRSCPVNLGEYRSLEFTDLDFEAGHSTEREPEDRTLFVCSRSGHVLEIDYKNVAVRNARRLLPSDAQHSHRREKQTFNSGPGIALNSICLSSTFCATASEDGYLRLWPLDFSEVFLEAEHDNPVTSVSISPDNLKVLCTTASGNVGCLDIQSRDYSTVMRSHMGSVLAFSVEGLQQELVTVSQDNTIRIWNLETMQQLYEFSASEETPCAVAFHPSQPIFACGFDTGVVRTVSLAASKLLEEHKQHRGSITGLVFSPDGNSMYSACSHGTLALYNCAVQKSHIVRVLANVVSQDADHSPDALSVSANGRLLAFVGPSKHVVTLMDAHSLDELLRIDVSILDLESPSLDTAVRLRFTPSTPGHLLVTTSSQKILVLDVKTGRLIRMVSQVHKQSCSSLALSPDSRYLLTAGDRVIKVWDYGMRFDVSSQVFIGHSELVRQVGFSPDQRQVISVGDAIFLWDFLGVSVQEPSKEELRRSSRTHSSIIEIFDSPRVETSPEEEQDLTPGANDTPRKRVPLPTVISPACLDLSSIQRMVHEDTFSESEEEKEAACLNGDAGRVVSGAKALPLLAEKAVQREEPAVVKAAAVRPASRPGNPAGDECQKEAKRPEPEGIVRPDCYRHFAPRFKTSVPSSKKLSLPPDDAEGLKLKAAIGYNGNGRGNMVWNPDTGLFAYSCGCMVIVEDLHSGSQQHWLGHPEEISTLAVSHDAQVVASASGCGLGDSRCQIRIWDVPNGACRKALFHHETQVQAMAYSRDDRLLVTLGDYTDRVMALWNTHTYELMTSTRFSEPVHEVAFSPLLAGHLACVGKGALTFWLMEEQGTDISLKVHRVPVPEAVGPVELTSLCYSAGCLLYSGTSSGQICAWDTETNRCFMTWEADEGEIGILRSHGNRLVSGSNTKRIRLWSVAAVRELRVRGSGARSNSVLLEQEMTLDGTIVSATFDDCMDMGIVGTTSGTLWYINWAENTSIRLISGHKNKVSEVAFSPDESHCATCGEDGSVRVWSLASMELVVQFQVLNQSCLCLSWSPVPVSFSGAEGQHIVAGYSDGTLRVFSISRTEMELKMHPHAVAVTALGYSPDGEIILSGDKEGLVAVSSPRTGMTIRVLTDHRSSPINVIDSTRKQRAELGVEGSHLWLAASADRRVSIWVSDWMKDKCELLDWLSFPAPAGPEVPHPLPPSLAAFCPWDKSTVVYSGFGLQKEILFYSLPQKQVVDKIPLPYFATSLSLSPVSRVIAVGFNERVLRLINHMAKTEQDYRGHDDAVCLCRFTPLGNRLFTTSYNEILVWEVRNGC
ncbi:LOW QUALITY PROTEIN: WD repeat-containing protein 90 [Heteronotia binoei]|uniref:LOW QUALITY PROTEIN: WD repeat-containing protein 90 n=1 Tax=Heteronotia binoei TaxID=13085 RepID=UPI0029315326|nr:LOW QUALITY PROTEIN: WD repeat-containing protein 90 [Heteronotia binoei]